MSWRYWRVNGISTTQTTCKWQSSCLCDVDRRQMFTWLWNSLAVQARGSARWVRWFPKTLNLENRIKKPFPGRLRLLLATWFLRERMVNQGSSVFARLLFLIICVSSRRRWCSSKEILSLSGRVSSIIQVSTAKTLPLEFFFTISCNGMKISISLFKPFLSITATYGKGGS